MLRELRFIITAGDISCHSPVWMREHLWTKRRCVMGASSKRESRPMSTTACCLDQQGRYATAYLPRSWPARFAARTCVRQATTQSGAPSRSVDQSVADPLLCNGLVGRCVAPSQCFLCDTHSRRQRGRPESVAGSWLGVAPPLPEPLASQKYGRA